MSDDKPVTPPGEAPPQDDSRPADADAPAAEKKPLSDEEKAAKVAAAKAKAAEKKKAAAEAAAEEPKPPWEEKPVPPDHEEVADDPDAAAIEERFPGAVIGADRFTGEVTLTVAVERVADICSFLKTDRGYRFLVDLTAVDWPERAEGRFDVIYWLHRHEDSKRLRLRAVAAEDAAVASVSGVWKTADWMEREAYDMYGIVFEGHPGLERILTWEGFNGHPLRKDFPVEGIDTGAAIYPEVYPPGGGPAAEAAAEEEGES